MVTSEPARERVQLRPLARAWGGATLTGARDLAPIVLVVAVFQLLVLREPFPDLGQTLIGFAAVLAGLTMFVQGLRLALFPVGEGIAHAFARRGSVPVLLLFAFALGFGTTVAEPALVTVADEAARVRAESQGEASAGSYATVLRYVVALSVGTSVSLGVVRIIRGWPIHYFIISGYAIVVALTALAPEDIIGIAYDSGGVTTSTITVPLVTALGIGLSMSIKGRSPMADGFGLIAFACLAPIVFVLLFGIVTG